MYIKEHNKNYLNGDEMEKRREVNEITLVRFCLNSQQENDA